MEILKQYLPEDIINYIVLDYIIVNQETVKSNFRTTMNELRSRVYLTLQHKY